LHIDAWNFVFGNEYQKKFMGRKEEYKLKNDAFFEEMRRSEGVNSLGGILYRVVNKGDGKGGVKMNSVVTVHYRGTLVDGREFDNSWKRGCPEAFRVNGLIEGFSIALMNMHVGDRWIVYIPQELGYGRRTSGPIPGNSVLTFEIELLGIS
jgi:peptidylprolyl isomerase